MVAPVLDDYAHLWKLRFPDGVDPATAPRVTLVTICFNAIETIGKTIDSVHAQDFPDLEHVIVDGGSTDGTVELVRSRLRPQDYLLSEKDRGISDALNKGVALAAGRYVQFIHADDWLSPTQISISVDRLEQSGADYVFGDLIFYEGGRPSFNFAGEPDYARAIDGRMPNINHPTVLATKECYEKVGLFDLRYRCAMDYDWFLRVHRAGGRGVHDPAILGHMNHDGVSNTQYLRTIDEVAAIAAAHGRALPLVKAERLFRITKIRTGRLVKGRMAPAYRLARRLLNPAYRPV